MTKSVSWDTVRAEVLSALAPLADPMLASAMKPPLACAAFDRTYRDWVLEEKLDGHRVVAFVRDEGVIAFSRPRGRSAAPNLRPLDPPIVAQLQRLGPGIYDGELVVPGGHAWDVVRIGATRVLVLFDLLELHGQRLTGLAYTARREQLLRELAMLPRDQTALSTVESVPASWAMVQAIWRRGGEGAVLKRPDSAYRPGHRSPDWVKVKPHPHATLTVVGFEEGLSGPCSAFLLRDDTGTITTVKVLGHALLREVTARPSTFIGRRVVISYQQRTPSGTYRHGIFDHFAGDGE